MVDLRESIPISLREATFGALLLKPNVCKIESEVFLWGPFPISYDPYCHKRPKPQNCIIVLEGKENQNVYCTLISGVY